MKQAGSGNETRSFLHRLYISPRKTIVDSQKFTFHFTIISQSGIIRPEIFSVFPPKLFLHEKERKMSRSDIQEGYLVKSVRVSFFCFFFVASMGFGGHVFSF